MEVPQISKNTNVSMDYWNEYFSKAGGLNHGLHFVAKMFQKFPIKKYEERFSREKYENVITFQNSERIKKLNELSDFVNEKFVDVSNFTEFDVKKVINKAHSLIYGIGENSFYPEINN